MDTLREVCFEGIDLTLDAGYTKPITAITLDGRAKIVKALMLHYTLYRNKAVLDQLKSGLATLGVLNAMTKYSQVLEPFFVAGLQPSLTAGKFMQHCNCL